MVLERAMLDKEGTPSSRREDGFRPEPVAEAFRLERPMLHTGSNQHRRTRPARVSSFRYGMPGWFAGIPRVAARSVLLPFLMGEGG